MYETEEIQQEAKEEKAFQVGSTECRSMGVTNSSACLGLVMVLYENGVLEIEAKGKHSPTDPCGQPLTPAAAVLVQGPLLPPWRLHLRGRRGFSHREAPGPWRRLRKTLRLEPLPRASLPHSQWV